MIGFYVWSCEYRQVTCENSHVHGHRWFEITYMKEQKEEPGRTEAAVKPDKEKNIL
jgi:hypothetical protein